MESRRLSNSNNVPNSLDLHHPPIQLGSSPGATSDISGTTDLNYAINNNHQLVGGHHNNTSSNIANSNTPSNHVIGEFAETDIHSVPSSPWRLGSTDSARNGYPPPARHVHTYPQQPQNSSMSMLSQSPSFHASGLHQQLQQQKHEQQQNKHPLQQQSYPFLACILTTDSHTPSI